MKKKAALQAALMLMSIAAVVFYIMLRTPLTVVNYTVKTDLNAPIRLVHLTDLHGWTFGENNSKLVQLVAEQAPDLILMTGDMMDKTHENADIACALIADLSAVAPVYFSYGNHEWEWMNNTSIDLRPILTEAGATVLDIEYLDIVVNGQELRLGGYYNYYRQPHMMNAVAEEVRAERAFADDFENTDCYQIFLNHIPTTWLDWNYIDKHPVDLVLCGHYHGGQVRLPFVGGLIAPYVGWFPEFTEGMYTGEMATAILSTGLGSSPGIPRVNNPPQIVVVDLVPNQ